MRKRKPLEWKILETDQSFIAPFINVGGTLLGVVAGYVLASWQRRKEDKERAKGIRRMLQTEIEYNIQALQYWDEAGSEYDFPSQSNRNWDTQLPEIPKALTPRE